MRKSKRIILFLCSLGFLAPFTFGSEDSFQSALKNFSKTARIVSATEIDASECGSGSHMYPMIRLDAKGDGGTDVAAFVKLGYRHGDPKQGESLSVKIYKIKLVLFLNNGKGGYEPLVLDEFESDMPTIRGLTVTKKGTVIREAEGGKKIKLEHDGIAYTSCGQFDDVYYWDSKRRKVENIVATD